MNKWSLVGVIGYSHDSFASYFHERKQFVLLLSENNSSLLPVDYKVVHCSSLGPVLFYIFDSNISKLDLHGKLFLFADDTTIHVKEKTLDNFYYKSACD